MKNTLTIDSVILEYGRRRILQDIYLSCETGKIIGLLGRNGTGKTSLLKTIFGEVFPSSKSVRINEKALLGSYRSYKDIKYLPQSNFIPKSLTLKRVFEDFDLDFQSLVNDFSIFQSLYDIKIKHLSGGERRIIEIYLILVSETKFCLLDEPFSQIMPVHVDTIKKIISREKENKGIILTDHLYQHVLSLSDKIHVINNGKTNIAKDIHDLEHLGYVPKLTK